MKTVTKDVLLISALMLALTGAVRADDGGGDNSMSQWTGESYAAFQRGELGDLYTGPKKMVGTEKAADESRIDLASAPAEVHAGPSVSKREPRNPFRDDTAG